MPQTDFNQQEQLAEARRLRRLEQRRRQRVQIRLVLFVLLKRSKALDKLNIQW